MSRELVRNYAVWDLETQTHTLFKRKASPWHPENFIVASGYKVGRDGVAVMDYTNKAGGLPDDWFTKLLDQSCLLVGFNIGFDLLHALQDQRNLDAWMDWVAAGGQVWDCQLAEYLLTGMVPESHMLSLNEVTVRYGGQLKVDAVKALWEAGVQTSDIDRDLLAEYLIGKDDHGGDIGNTELAYLGQVKKARGRGQLKSIQLNMGALVCAVEMMRNGLYVNMARGLELAEKLREDLAAKGQELAAYLPEGLPFEFNWTNRYHLSPLIFGGTVKYKARCIVKDDEGKPVYPQTTKTAYVVAGEATDIFVEDGRDPPENVDRFAGGKNKGEAKTKKVKVPDIAAGPKTRMEDLMFEFPGFTEPEQRWASSTEGLYSVASEVIEELGSRDIPFLNTLSAVAKMSKDLSTYYISEEEGKDPKGMLTLVGDDGIIHGSLNMTSTVTARLSHSGPNLGNIPRGDTSDVKSVFESRFGKKGKIAQSDFKSLEVFVQAILTGDKQLIKDLRDGLDMHCARLATAEGVTYEESLLKAKGSKTVAALPEWDEKRTHIKTFSFQRAYGAGAPKIAAYLKVPVELVEGWIEADKARYPGIESWYEWLGEHVKRSRKPTAKHVMHPEVRGLNVQLGRGYYRAPSGKLYAWTEVPSPAWQVKSGVMATFMPTELRNYPIQGEGGEWMKAAMWLLVREFYARRNFGGLALLVNTVHDAACGDFHEDVEDEACAVLHACMEAASELMEYHFDWKIPVGVPSETGTGPNMKEETHISAEVIKAANELRPYLREKYFGGHRASFLNEEDA